MKILFCDVDEVTKKYLKKYSLLKNINYVIFEKSLNDLSDTELKSHYKDTNIISTFVYSRLTKDILSKFKKLKFISTRSTGYNNVDLDYCKKNKIKVANVEGYGEITVAEFAIGALLNLTRKIEISHKKLLSGIVNTNNDIGIDLYGKTIGVLGTGSIGGHFAKLANAFGCNVLAYDIYPNKDLEKSKILKYTDLNTILKQSDIISLHCPATTKNYHLINDKTISIMKNGVYIVNTARGDLIDSFALYNNLKSGKIAGAALDALEYEDILIKNNLEVAVTKDKKFLLYSLINQKLLQLDNVIITPHTGFNSIEAIYRILDSSMQNTIDFINHKEVKSVI